MAFMDPPLFPPGTGWHYSNTNYVLLGLIMEQVTGQAVADLFQERLFTPLGMQNTLMPALTDASIPQPYAHGYLFGTAEESGGADPAVSPADQQAAAAGTLQPDDWSDSSLSWGWTAGSVITTADDLAVFLDALVDGGLLDAQMQQRRLDSIQPTSPGAFGYGMGMMKIQSYYGHNGQIPGYQSFMVRDPDTDTSVIVLTALTSAPDGRLPADALATATIAALGDL